MDASLIKKELGLRIKSFRNSKGLTQESFGVLIGLEQTNVSNIENGKTFPDIKTLCDIVSLAGAEPNYLLNFLQSKEKAFSSIDFELIDLIVDLPSEAKKYLLNLINALKK